jgi:decaprenyl-phosphate phosphoribosyltransferase
MTDATHTRGIGETADASRPAVPQRDAPSDAHAAQERPSFLLPPSLRLMRPHQWVKNAFIAAPLLLTPAPATAANAALLVLGMTAFSVLASGVYVLNDLADREADRRHPRKRHRPIASGEISPATAVAMMAALVAAGLGGAFALSPAFGLIAAGYFALNVAYSFWLKNASILDVLVIAAGFMLRVWGGLELLQAEASVWVLNLVGLLTLFIAMAKRRDDLVRTLAGDHRRSLSGYSKPFLDTAMAVVLATLLISYVNYTSDPQVIDELGTDRLYLTVPFVLAGILRYLQISLVEERSGTPTSIVLTDRFLVTAVVLWGACFALLVQW